MENRQKKIVLVGCINEKRPFVQKLKEKPPGSQGKLQEDFGLSFFIKHHRGQAFQIWDTVSDDRFFHAQKIYLKDADAIIFFNVNKAKEEEIKKTLPSKKIIIHFTNEMKPLDCLDHIQTEFANEIKRQTEEFEKITLAVDGPEEKEISNMLNAAKNTFNKLLSSAPKPDTAANFQKKL